MIPFFAAVLLASAAGRKTLPGHVPQGVPALTSNGVLKGTNRLALGIGLPLRNQQSLSNLLRDIYNPASPQYHEYLSSDQFVEQFGPTPSNYQAVVNFAQANGFTVTATHPDRMLLDVSATATAIQRAFQVQLLVYRHPKELRNFYSPNVEPSVPSDLPVADICGLNNYLRPHPNFTQKIIVRDPKTTSMDGSGPNGNLIGGDYRAAYIPGITLTGTGQTVGLFEYDNFYPSDVTTYESIAGLTNPPPVRTLFLNGYDGAQGEGDGEVALDIETAMSMAPGLSAIVCFETSDENPANDILSVMATNTAIKQFSCSWNFGSNPRATMDSYFQKMDAQGQSFFDASGDQGAYTKAISEPNDDPYITIVGGTTLSTTGPGDPWLGEVTWNAPDIGDSSSGGISTTYAIPSWQVGVSTAANKASTTKRNIPDVSMVADNIFIMADNGLEESSGGTSAAAPLWAAFIALVNQQSLAAGNSTVGFINPAIYAMRTNGYAALFDDITVGNNTNGNTGFFATPGYDLCTGLGTPAGGSLMIALTTPDGFLITPGRGLAANGATGGPFNISAQTFVLTNSGGNSLSWSLSGAPAWLTVPSQGGILAPASTASITVLLNHSANALPPGVYTANLWFTNLTSGLSQLRQFTLQVEQNLIHDGGFEAGDFCYWTLSGLDAWEYNYADNGTYSYYYTDSGNYFAVLSEPKSLAYLSQPLPTQPGQLYLVSFWLANPSGDSPNQFVVNWNNGNSTNTLYNQSSLGAFNWEQMQLFAVAQGNSTLLRFGGLDPNYFLGLDDISVEPIPMPTIQSIQQIGDTLQITWNAVSGLNYQVQYTDTLLNPQWTDLGSVITATGTTATVTETITPGGQQFYRIILSVPM
ncbi:MAG TPA: protease pro-enzyme activation domain-containing protein [Verrucomicrobiae bacterium]|nr:protease pro-enzyme activation domain-containing protein [Verrucomicrobiae bacterium]